MRDAMQTALVTRPDEDEQVQVLVIEHDFDRPSWTMLAFAFVLAPIVVWIRYVDAHDAEAALHYLMPVFVSVILTVALVARLVRNGVELRVRYRAALAELGKTWTEIDALKPAPDPTIAFIGADWWKLPATLGSLAFAAWGVLEWTGASSRVVSLFR